MQKILCGLILLFVSISAYAVSGVYVIYGVDTRGNGQRNRVEGGGGNIHMRRVQILPREESMNYSFGYVCSSSCTRSLNSASAQCLVDGQVVESGKQYGNYYIYVADASGKNSRPFAQFDAPASFTSPYNWYYTLLFVPARTYQYGYTDSIPLTVGCTLTADIIGANPVTAYITYSFTATNYYNVYVSTPAAQTGSLGQPLDFPFKLTFQPVSSYYGMDFTFEWEIDPDCSAYNPIIKSGSDTLLTGTPYLLHADKGGIVDLTATLTPTSVGDFSCPATLTISNP